jgi:hypothetical protein
VIIASPEKTALEISCLKGVERDLKLRDPRKSAKRSLVDPLSMAVPVHKDLQDEKTTEPESTERREGIKGGNEGRKRLNLILS